MDLWFPLDALLVSQLAHDGAGTSFGLQKHLKHHPAIRSYGITGSFENALDYITDKKTNTLFIDPCLGSEIWKDADLFILNVREKYPDIVIVIYTSEDCRKIFIEKYHRFEHYFYLQEIWGEPGDENNLPKEKELNSVLIKCDDWHKKRFTYDIGISYAGEDRKIAEEIVTGLKRLSENRIFFDKDEEADMLGKNLFTTLADVYSNRCRYSIVVVSKNYKKVWTKHEKRALEERALTEEDYIIPIMVDDTKISGLFITTTAYLTIEKGIDQIVKIINKKLWVDGTQQKKFIDRSLY